MITIAQNCLVFNDSIIENCTILQTLSVVWVLSPCNTLYDLVRSDYFKKIRRPISGVRIDVCLNGCKHPNSVNCIKTNHGRFPYSFNLSMKAKVLLKRLPVES